MSDRTTGSHRIKIVHVRAARAVLLAMIVGHASHSPCAEEQPAKRTLGWFNQTDLSVVVSNGNSDVSNIALKDTLRWLSEKTRFRFKVDMLRTENADDRFLLVDPDLTFLPGETPTDATTHLVEPGIEPDIQKYLIEARVDRDINELVLWDAGASWDRNLDAGIVNRYTVFAGIGNTWVRYDDLRFFTSYSASYTDREEEQPDPEKEERFAGLRLDVELLMRLAESTTFESDLSANVSLADTSDYTLDITNAFQVAINSHVALKVSLQWLFNSEPGLEDVDVIARVEVIDPDGIPGTGDEFFRTLSSGGSELTVGEDRVRKEDLDTIFRTTLVLSF